ncbi:MAG: flagellar filament capping protein FliD [Acetivibrionales bacterium]|jgi:flagellar hook-associated protein 2|nr:flagellar filament capping protein FliD [Clostridiaceae bacterium]
MNGISGFTSQMRVTGLTGFDTDSIVEQLMNAERMPLDVLKQKRTVVEWRQEAYREISASLISFKSKFFDIVNRSSYMLSSSSIKAMSASSSNSSYVTATASSGAIHGAHSIKVNQLATAISFSNSARISKGIEGSIEADKLGAIAEKKIFVELDGVSKQITLGGSNAEEFRNQLQASLDEAFGKAIIDGEEVSKFNISVTNNENGFDFSIDTASGSGATKVSVYGPSGATEEMAGLDDLHLFEAQSNRLSLNSRLIDLKDSFGLALEFDEDENAEFSINGEKISIKSTDTLKQIFDKINNNDRTGAKISYDELTDKITLSSTITGAGNNLEFDDISGNFLSALNLDDKRQGTDAVVSINGETLVRSTNNFTVNGITYNLHKAHGADSEGDSITVTQDTDSVINNIKSFIEDYNKLIDDLYGKTTEKSNRSYQPLTDAQREEMKENEIEKWEKQAKKGLLRSDSIIQNLLLSMRTALYENVEGVSISLKDIGIASKSYSDNGKLYLDEDKLKNMLLSKPDEVAKLLNGVSSDNPSYSRTATAEQRTDRYRKSGVLQRVSDIIQNHVSTIRDTNGNKGILLEKAGIEGDLSSARNLISDQLKDYDDRISNMIDKLTKKEETYYKRFATLEKMLNQMNQQSAWIMSQFNFGQ